jgi:anti-sigma regulatory factor (Ser/Thr protein kinase)
MSKSLQLTLRNHVSEIGRLVERIEGFGQEAGLPDDVTFRLTLALDEIVSNVIRHGLDAGSSQTVSVTLDIADGIVTATVVDDGRPFDPHDAPQPNLDAPIEERTPGGLGVHLVKASMDEVIYRRDGSRNVLTMKTSVQSRDSLA